MGQNRVQTRILIFIFNVTLQATERRCLVIHVARTTHMGKKCQYVKVNFECNTCLNVKFCKVFRKYTKKAWECSFVSGHLPSIHKSLDLISDTKIHRSTCVYMFMCLGAASFQGLRTRPLPTKDTHLRTGMSGLGSLMEKP